MKIILTTLMFIALIASSTAVAQDLRYFPPPIKPFYQKTLAPQEVWIYDTGIVNTAEGYVFTAKVKVLFFAGVDKDGKRIAYKYGKNRGDVVQDDPFDFELIDEVFTGSAYLKVGVDNKVVARTKFKVTGGLGRDKKAGEKDGVIEFEPIPSSVKILPTTYKFIAEINPSAQYKFKNYIWIDKEERKRKGGSQNESITIVREDPRRALPVSVDAFIMVKNDSRGRIETFKEGAINFYENALNYAKRVPDLEKQIKEIKNKMKKENDLGILSNLESSMYQLQTRIKKYSYWRNDSINRAIKADLEKARTSEGDFKLAVHQYDRKAKIGIVDVLTKIYKFYREIYYTSFGCLPNWTTKNKKNMAELDKKYKISSYLKKGTPGDNIKKGDWKSDKWMDNLEDNWMKQIQGIKDDFLKIFGKAMTDEDANKNDPNYYGMLADGTRKFWEPVFKTGYEELYEYIFKDDILTVTIKALANLLTQNHTFAKNIKYPFMKEGTIKPVPSPSSAYSYATKLGQVKKNICKLIYSCAIPPETINKPVEDDNNKNKTEWVCSKCKAKSAHRPPTGKCPVCGEEMVERPVEKDQDDVGEGGR